MTRRNFVVAAAAALALAGCAAIMNRFSSHGVISEQKSAVDGSEVVEVSGNRVLGNGGMSTFDGALLGARWESVNPGVVHLLVTYVSSAAPEPIVIEFDELRINVNGSVTAFKPVGPAVTMPLPYLESMLVADTCKLQLIRGANVTEGDFAIASDAGAPTAKVSLQRFYDRVRAIITEPSIK